MKSQSMFGQAERQLGETVAFVGLGAAGVVMIAFAAWSMLNLMAQGDQVAAALSDKASIAAQCKAAPPCAVIGSASQEVQSGNPPSFAPESAADSTPGAALRIWGGAPIWIPAPVILTLPALSIHGGPSH